MHHAATLAVVLATTEHTTTVAVPSVTSGTLAVALVGAASAVVVALVPELAKLLRRAEAHAPDPAETVTTAVLEALEVKLTERGEARAHATRAVATGAAREVRALRTVLETRDRENLDRAHAHELACRAEFERLRDDLQRHLWGDHGQTRRAQGMGPDSGPIPAQRAPEPA